jgi:7 transmembrane sweet-taste receptor of 3 GCPR
VSPDAEFFFKAFTLTTDDQQSMLALLEYRNLTAEEAACAWVTSNNETWSKWFLTCDGEGKNGCNDEAGECVAGDCVCDWRYMGATCEIAKIIDYVEYSDAAAIFLMTVASILILAAFGLVIVTFVNRTRPAVSYASPLFLELIVFGAIVGYTAAYVWAGKPNSVNCQLRYWLLSLSFITVFG